MSASNGLRAVAAADACGTTGANGVDTGGCLTVEIDASRAVSGNATPVGFDAHEFEE